MERKGISGRNTMTFMFIVFGQLSSGSTPATNLALQCGLDIVVERNQGPSGQWYGLAGHNLFLECNGTDSALFYRNNQLLTVGDRIYKPKGNLLTIQAVNTSDTGLYYCTRPDVSCRSNALLVGVLKERELNVLTPNVTVGVGQKIDIRVGVTNVKESGPFKAVWSHNGQQLEESGRVQIGTESSWLNVSISNAMMSDEGIYLLHVSDNVSSSRYKVVEVFVIDPTVSKTVHVPTVWSSATSHVVHEDEVSEMRSWRPTDKHNSKPTLPLHGKASRHWQNQYFIKTAIFLLLTLAF